MKRGQITIFIIVGIVILLVLGLGVAAWKYFAVERPPEDKIIEETNNELEPIRLFVKECLDSTGRDVFDTIGLHGGYYDPQAYGYVAIPEQPTTSSAFEPFSGQVVPYWNYVSSPNTCLSCAVESEQPPLEGPAAPAIQFQAQQAIAEQLSQCIAGFEQFEGQYVITPRSEPQVSVSFGEQNIVLGLNYVVDVQTQAGAVSTLRDFTTVLDIPFRKIYNTAEEIRLTNDVSHFFEGLTIETITLLSLEEGEPIPPPFGISESTYDPGPFWILEQTRGLLASALEDSVNIVQLFGSIDMSYVATGDRVTDAQYKNYYFSIQDTTPDVRANFLYLSSWRPYVRTHPGGQVIKPDVYNPGILPFIPPLKRKEFSYDVSYPVLVQLQAPLTNGAYFFQFPLEINIRSNQPLPYEPFEEAPVSISFCDPALWKGSRVNLTVQDTAGRLVNARVRYDCLSQSCTLGSTVNGKLQTSLPACLGGKLVAERDFYVPGQQGIDSVPEGQAETTITMIRFTTVNVSALEYAVVKESYLEGTEMRSRWALATNNAFDVPANHNLVVIFTPRDDQRYTQVVSYPSKTEVQLYPTTYDVTAVLMANMSQPHVIPEETRCYDTGLFSDDECITIAEIRLGDATAFTDPDTGATSALSGGSFYIGGLLWDTTTKNVTFTQEDLDRGSMTIPVVAINLNQVNTVEDLEVFDKINELSAPLEIMYN